MKKTLFLSLFTGFALSGCIQDNSPKEPDGKTGRARIKLPELPAGSAKTVPGLEYNLTVTVSGTGMHSRTHSWRLSEFGGKTVSIEDIPAGADRVFTGILMRGMVKTHEGRHTADIAGGGSAYVPLVLRDVGTGRAEICVEIEGWPWSPECAPIDTLPVDTIALSGCWHIEAQEAGQPLIGKLSVHSMEGVPFGIFTSRDGGSYYVAVEYVLGAWRLTLHPRVPVEDMGDAFGIAKMGIPNVMKPYGAPSDWYRTYQIRIDTFSFGPADQPNGIFWGVLMDPSFRNVVGKVTGTTSLCYPEIVTDTAICVLPALERIPG